MMKKQGIPNTSELDDDQIEALIRKLSAIKGSAPELLAALKDEASSRLASRSGSRATSTATRSGGSTNRATAAVANAAPGREGRGGPIRAVDYEDEYGDDYEEETESEEDDEFDEDGPCVGYGYSDEASVMSEMTTPTVVSNLSVAEEERYNEIHQGYGAGNRSKKPDLLSQVNRVNAARSKQAAAPPQRNANSNPDHIDPVKRKAYTSGLSAMAKINEGEPAAISKPQRKPTASATGAPTTTKTSSSRRAPQPPQRKNSSDGTAKIRTGRGLKKKSSSAENSGEEEVVRSKSPTTKVRTKKSSSSHSKSKSSSSFGSGSGSKGSGERRTTTKRSDSKGKSFADDWHKSLSGADFDESNMDDNGFPFSFGEEADNAFGASKSSGWGNAGGNGGGAAAAARNAFDPFDDADGFDAFQEKAPQKKTSSGGRSKPSGSLSSRPKRDTSPNAPKRKPVIR